MDPIIELSEFTSDDAANLRAFLATKSGQKTIAALTELSPPLLEGGPVNEILIRSGKALGYGSAVVALVALANPQPERKPEPANYASLTDDKAWNDGQTITDATEPNAK